MVGATVTRRWALAAGMAGAALLASAPPTFAAPAPVRVEGHYRIVSTDCYFGQGHCSTRLDIVQTGSKLSDPTDPNFHGQVHGDHVRISENVPCCSEDGWAASGISHDGGRVIKGTFYDGLGGTGTFTMTYKGP